MDCAHFSTICHLWSNRKGKYLASESLLDLDFFYAFSMLVKEDWHLEKMSKILMVNFVIKDLLWLLSIFCKLYVMVFIFSSQNHFYVSTVYYSSLELMIPMVPH